MNQPDLSQLTPKQLGKELAIAKLRTASVELSLAATCLHVNATTQAVQYFNEAITNLDAVRAHLFPEKNEENKAEAGPS